MIDKEKVLFDCCEYILELCYLWCFYNEDIFIYYLEYRYGWIWIGGWKKFLDDGLFDIKKDLEFVR